MDNKALSKRQRQILALMKVHGSAAFFGDTRDFMHWVSNHGLIIKAYQSPEYFLKNRGLIERVESNSPGRWYRMTPDGARRAATIRED
jgi:hypothetical protein